MYSVFHVISILIVSVVTFLRIELIVILIYKSWTQLTSMVENRCGVHFAYAANFCCIAI